MAYISGAHKFICDLCGFEGLSLNSVKTWDNLIVHSECYDGARSPQDYLVRPRADRQAVSDARPELAVTWIPKYLTTELSEHLLMENGDNISREYTS